LIENDEGVTVEYSLKFEFQTSNNQAEYETCLARIRAAKELGATAITLCSDSQILVSQIQGDYQAKEPLLQKYVSMVRESSIGLSKFEIKHVSRAENSRANLLSTSAFDSVIEEVIPTPCTVLQVENDD
jgi:ribonuclease HI